MGRVRRIFSGFRARELVRDIIVTSIIIALVCVVLYIYAGIWPPLVSVDGTSMYPDLKEGDLVILRGLDRVNVVTQADAIASGYMRFNGYGDVIVYNPLGNRSRTPVIHRAMYYVKDGEPMWPGGPRAPHAGYITLGDNNFMYDQSSSISPSEPVSPEWVIGVSQFRVPYLGLVRSRIATL